MPDLKLAARTLRKSPFVTLVAVLSLALGIGANGAIYSLFDQLLLRPLPVPEPERLVNLGAPGPKPGSQSCNNAGPCEDTFSYPMFRDLQERQTVFTGLAAHRSFSANLAFDGQTSSTEGMLVSGSYFPTLGLKPALGRLLDPGDDREIGESRVAVLSYDAWRNRFAEDRGVLNRELVVNGHRLTIVGVAPRGFRGTTLGSRPEVFVPISLRGLMSPGFDGFEDRRSYWAYLFGRLQPGVSLEEARAQLGVPYSALIREVEAPLQEGMSEATMEKFRQRQLTMEVGEGGQTSVREQARTPLMLLFAVTGVVLLIACANVANLLLARSASRGSEMAVRLSVGAGRGQLIAQLLTEACLLAALGGLAGLAVARGTLVLIGRLLPAEAASVIELSLDWQVVAFAGALALGTGLLFGLFPALHGTRVDLTSALKGQTGQTTGARSASRFRSSLVTAQIALATALLVSAGLFTKSLLNVSRIDLGLDTEQLATFGVAPELNGYSPERSRILFQRLEEELEALPGVSGVGASMVPLLGGSSWGSSVKVEGFDAGPDTDVGSRYNEIGPGYFGTLGIPLVAGREFTDADVLDAPKVAIVNETFAEKFGLGRRAVGKRMAVGFGDAVELDMEIVGLVEDAKYNQVKEEIPPLFFLPYRQDDGIGAMNFYVRSELPPERLLPSISEVVAGLDENLPVEELKTMPQQVRESIFLDRFLTALSSGFALLATLLAAVGLYGVLAYTVSQRTREIGLRMALGADGGRVRRMVLAQVGRLTVVGGAIGLAAALGLGHLMRSQLYGLGGQDPTVLGSAVLLLGLVSLGAGFVPALKASRTDPMRALRYE